MVLVLDRADLVHDADLGRRLHDLHGKHRGLRVIVAVRDAGSFWPWGLPHPEIVVISPVELLFTVDELAELFADNGLPLTSRSARDVLHQTGGQPVFIDRALRIGRLFGSRPGIGWSGAAPLFHDACDRFVEDTLDAALDVAAPPPRALRVYALALAPMTRMSIAAATALQIHDAEDVLSALERGGLVARVPDQAGPRWTFPAGVRASILRRAAAGVAPPSDAVAAAAHLLADTESQVDALQFAMDARAWHLAAKLIIAHWVSIGLASVEVLTDALTELPGDVVLANPALFYGRELALAMRPTRAGEAPRPAGPEVRGPATPMLTTGDEIRALVEDDSVYPAVLGATLRSVFYRWRGDYAEAVRHNDMLAALSPGSADGAGEGALLLPTLWLHLGQSSHLHDDAEDAARFFRLAIAGSAGPPFDFSARQAAGHLAFLHAVQGETRQAQRWIERESEYGEYPG